MLVSAMNTPEYEPCYIIKKHQTRMMRQCTFPQGLGWNGHNSKNAATSRLSRTITLLAMALILTLSLTTSWGADMQAGENTVVARQLAPTGRLRAAINLGNGVLAQRDSRSGELAGVSVALARELAMRLGTDLELIVYDAAGMVFEALDRDEWDIAFLGREPERAAKMYFSRPYVQIDGTYLVRSDSNFQQVGDLDQEGIRIAVGRGAAYDLYLSRTLEKASIERLATSAEAIQYFLDGESDAAAGVRQSLTNAAEGQAELKVLEDRYMLIDQALAVPLGRDSAIYPWVEAFIEEMRASGFIRAVLDSTGQTSAIVP